MTCPMTRPGRAALAARLGAVVVLVALAAGCAGGGGDRPPATAAATTRTAPATSAPTTSITPAVAEGPGAGCLRPEHRGEQVTFAGGNGARLAGVVLGRGRAGVVLAHQHRGSLCQWLRYGVSLAGKGYRVLLFDFEGSGESEAAPGAPGSTLDADVAAAAAELRSRGVAKVVLVGASMGGTAVLGAAATVRPPVDGVVSLSGTTFFRGVDAVEAAAELTMPVLFVAAEGDGGFATDARALHDAGRQRGRRLLIVPGAGHGVDLLDPTTGVEAVAAEVEAFLRAHAR